MKALIILIVLGGLGLVAVYYLGGFATLDPAAQGEDFYNRVERGMSWEQVVAIKKPKKFYTFNPDPNSLTGRSPEQDFDESAIRDMVSRGAVDGFGFDYVFTGDHAWELTFDERGVLIAIEKKRTTKDLFTLPS